MPASPVLGIGPVALRLESPEADVNAYLFGHYGRYFVPGLADACLRVATGHAYDPMTAHTIRWQDGESGWQADSGALSLTYDDRRHRGTVTVTADPDGLPSAIDNAIRGIGARLLAASGHLLVHSCGIVVDGGLSVFYGPSGVGKTTLARLAAEAGLPVVGDDLLIIDPVTRTGGGSPFWGDGADLPADRTWWPITGCWRLTQAADSTKSPLEGAAAVAELLCQIPLPPQWASDLLTRVMTLTRGVPQHRLTLRRPGSWQEVQEVAFG